MKLFQTNNIETVTAGREFFGFELLSVLLPKRVKIWNVFYDNYVLIVTNQCVVFVNI